jgi:hypothetical protein
MKIVDAKVIVCSPGRHFVTLKIVTEDGIHGLGDATLNGRELAVASYLNDHVIPLLIGRDARRIEDTWHYLYKGASAGLASPTTANNGPARWFSSDGNLRNDISSRGSGRGVAPIANLLDYDRAECGEWLAVSTGVGIEADGRDLGARSAKLVSCDLRFIMMRSAESGTG